MLGFAPGRISTIATPLKRYDEYIHASYLPVKPFEPADLPCPPMSIMTQAWYSPEPWVPYRPIFALPDEIRALKADLAHCENIKFAALDPPIPLTPQSVLVPNTPDQSSLAKPEGLTKISILTFTSGTFTSSETPPASGVTLDKGPVKTMVPEQASPSSKEYTSASSNAAPGNKKHPQEIDPVEGHDVDGVSGQDIFQNAFSRQHLRPFSGVPSITNNQETDTEKPAQHNDKSVDSTDPSDFISVLSEIGLSPGQGTTPEVKTTNPAPDHDGASSLTLFIDSNGNVISRPEDHTALSSAWDGTKPDSAISSPTQSITTSVSDKHPLVILPNGEGVSIAGTTIYPSPVLANLPATAAEGKHPDVFLSGTHISFLGASALVLGGSITVPLPTPAPAVAPASTQPDTFNPTDNDKHHNGDITNGGQASQGISSLTSAGLNNGSDPSYMVQATEAPQAFTGSASSKVNSLPSSWDTFFIACILTGLILSAS